MDERSRLAHKALDAKVTTLQREVADLRKLLVEVHQRAPPRPSSCNTLGPNQMANPTPATHSPMLTPILLVDQIRIPSHNSSRPRNRLQSNPPMPPLLLMRKAIGRW
jgi:hypothetical protein